jgi:hypothetical protein
MTEILHNQAGLELNAIKSRMQDVCISAKLFSWERT